MFIQQCFCVTSKLYWLVTDEFINYYYTWWTLQATAEKQQSSGFLFFLTGLCFYGDTVKHNIVKLLLCSTDFS